MPKLGEGRKERSGNQDEEVLRMDEDRQRARRAQTSEGNRRQGAVSEWVQREPVASQAQ